MKEKWALVLGASGGFGLAACRYLSSLSFNLIMVFRERKFVLNQMKKEFDELEENGAQLILFNRNINDDSNIEDISEQLVHEHKLSNKISFVLHAVADGNLKSFFPADAKDAININDLSHTTFSMGHSFATITQTLFYKGLLQKGASVVGLTSEGVDKYFNSYAAIASAKAVLESHMRYMAVELAPHKIRVNLIKAGITDTNALKAFPDYEGFILKAKKRNPSGRLTKPEDINGVIDLLASDKSEHITGTIFTIDGGEHLISI
jgi:enoyl-[acyl-carrier protein] reductase III